MFRIELNIDYSTGKIFKNWILVYYDDIFVCYLSPIFEPIKFNHYVLRTYDFISSSISFTTSSVYILLKHSTELLEFVNNECITHFKNQDEQLT